MRHTTRSSTRPLIRRRGGSIVALLALLVVAVAFNGCSRGQRYRTLSFFFDGVPDPYAPPKIPGQEDDASQQGVGGAAKVFVVLHKPYRDNRCNECHTNTGGNFEDFQKLESTICLKCHQKVQTEYPVMHGPVVVTECNICHVPHESSIPHLLRDTAPTVCVQCHQPELLSPNPKEHLMPNKSCLDCHSGHGGQKHGLLKAGLALNAGRPEPPRRRPKARHRSLRPRLGEACDDMRRAEPHVRWPARPASRPRAAMAVLAWRHRCSRNRQTNRSSSASARSTTFSRFTRPGPPVRLTTFDQQHDLSAQRSERSLHRKPLRRNVHPRIQGCHLSSQPG